MVTGWETVHAKVHTFEKIPSNNNRAFVSLHGNVSHIVVGLVGIVLKKLHAQDRI